MNATDTCDDVRGSGPLDWDSIDWKKAEESVRKLQARIVKAQVELHQEQLKVVYRVDTRLFDSRPQRGDLHDCWRRGDMPSWKCIAGCVKPCVATQGYCGQK